MRRLIADLYKTTYRRTEFKLVSFFFALIYITSLNLLSIYGIGILLEDGLPQLRYIHKLFSFPYVVVLAIALLYFNFRMMLPLHKLSEEMDIKPAMYPIIVYTIASALLCAYTLLANRVI